MRQVGFMAAAGLYALDNHVDRLEIDHQRASEIAQTLKKLHYISDVESTETNIVIFYLQEGISEEKFINDLLQNNVKISSMGQGKLRIVTHYDYTKEMHDKFLEIITNYK